MSRHRKDDLENLYLYFQQIKDFKVLSKEEERNLLNKIAKGDSEAKEKLVLHNLKLVAHFANKYRGRGLDYLDLIQVGNLALMKAAEDYDHPTIRFSSYASKCIISQIVRSIENSGYIRIPLHNQPLLKRLKAEYTELGKEGLESQISKIALEFECSEEIVRTVLAFVKKPISLGASAFRDKQIQMYETIRDKNALNKEEQLVSESAKEYIWDVISEVLTERELFIVKNYNNPNAGSPTLTELGEELGISRERVRQIKVAALKKVSEAVLKNDGTFTDEIQSSLYIITNEPA